MITAKLRHLRISPRKVRLVVDLIRGMDATEAEKQLKFLPQRAARPVLKLLNSAVANALNNFKAIKENLFITKIAVDPGPTLKRWLPRAMGRATPIMKRTSHITIVLESKEPLPASSAGKPDKKETKEKTEKSRRKVGIPTQKASGKDLDLLEEVTQPISQPVEEEKSDLKLKAVAPRKPYQTTSQSKKKFFSRQTFGNAKKIFRRKSI